MRILRRPEVKEKTGLSDDTIDREEQKGNFPRRIQLSSGCVGWFEEEIDEHLASLPRGPLSVPDSLGEAKEGGMTNDTQEKQNPVAAGFNSSNFLRLAAQFLLRDSRSIAR